MPLRRRLIVTFWIAALGFVVAACELPPTETEIPQLTYQHMPKHRFDVRELEVVEAYQPPFKAPNVEHLFPVKPMAAATRWAYDRIAPVGSQRRIRYTVREASVTEAPLDVQGGVKGAFTTDQAERYLAQLVVKVEILSDTGLVEGAATAKAERSVTVPENITLNERERVWFKLTERTMSDLSAQLDKTLVEVFDRYMIR